MNDMGTSFTPATRHSIHPPIHPVQSRLMRYSVSDPNGCETKTPSPQRLELRAKKSGQWWLVVGPSTLCFSSSSSSRKNTWWLKEPSELKLNWRINPHFTDHYWSPSQSSVGSIDRWPDRTGPDQSVAGRNYKFKRHRFEIKFGERCRMQVDSEQLAATVFGSPA